VPALVAGMVAGADSINDRTCSGVAAWVGCSAALRAFTFGHVCQLDAVDSQFLPRLSGQAPILAGRGADGVAGPRRQCHPDLWLREASRWPRLHRSQRAERVGRHRLHPLGGAGDRRNAATSGERPLVRGAATLVRGAAGRPPLWSLWTGYSSHRFGVLYPRRGHRGPRGRSPIQCHHPALPIGDQGSRRHRRHPDSLAPIAYATSIRDTPRQKALLAAATGSNGDQLRVPLTKFEVRCATHLVHRRNVPRPQ
jgi:hypothetical protein